MSKQIAQDRQLIQFLLCQYYDDSQLEIQLSVCTGGDIHRSYRVTISSSSRTPEQLFAKVNNLSHQAVIESEHNSLCILQKLVVPFYPEPISKGFDTDSCCLVMTHHPLGKLDEKTAAKLGEVLARQHQFSAATFGWEADNHIGLSKQYNAQTLGWIDFYRNQRLLPQLKLAASNALDSDLIKQVERIMASLEMFFPNYDPLPSLLHGDLWSGNVARGSTRQQPLLFDPAPFYGDREVDIAMTELFGKFPLEFYQAYQSHWPLHEGYVRRKPLYNLYHALNHFNLFGTAYSEMIRRFCIDLHHPV